MLNNLDKFLESQEVITYSNGMLQHNNVPQTDIMPHLAQNQQLKLLNQRAIIKNNCLNIANSSDFFSSGSSNFCI